LGASPAESAAWIPADVCLIKMEGKSLSYSTPSLFSSGYFWKGNTVNLSMYITGETKHNIDKLVDDLKCVVRLEASQEECPNIVQILDSVVNVSKTSIGGIAG